GTGWRPCFPESTFTLFLAAAHRPGARSARRDQGLFHSIADREPTRRDVMSISSWLRNRQPKRRPMAPVLPQLQSLAVRRGPSTLHVTNVSSSSNVKGSLPYELAHTSASGKDTIVIQAVGQINLNSELLITRGVTIKGPGAGLLTLTTNFNP